MLELDWKLALEKTSHDKYRVNQYRNWQKIKWDMQWILIRWVDNIQFILWGKDDLKRN